MWERTHRFLRGALFTFSRRLERMMSVISFALVGTQIELRRICEMSWIGFLYIVAEVWYNMQVRLSEE